MNQKNTALYSILALCAILIGCDTTAHIAHNDQTSAVPTTQTSQVLESDLSARPVPSTTNILPVSEEIVEDDTRFVNRLRVWFDENGNHSVNAELVSVSLNKRSIKLLKENGITVDVSIDHLSSHDRNFLNHAIHSLRKNLVIDDDSRRTDF